MLYVIIVTNVALYILRINYNLLQGVTKICDILGYDITRDSVNTCVGDTEWHFADYVLVNVKQYIIVKIKYFIFLYFETIFFTVHWRKRYLRRRRYENRNTFHTF